MVRSFSKLPVWALVAALAAASATSAVAADQMQEDLSNCKLPNGSVLLPLQGSSAAANGYLIRFHDQQYTSLPKPEAGAKLTSAQIVDQLRTAKSADVMYLAANNGTLWSVSGRVQDLGTKYLHAAAANKLDVPGEIPAGKLPAGTLTDIAEGRTYLIECTNGCYVLLRALKKTDLGLQAQFVYQPNGSLDFSVPKGELEELLPLSTLIPTGSTLQPQAAPTAKTERTAEASLPPTRSRSIAGMSLNMNKTDGTTGTTLEPFLGSHLRQRTMLIDHRMTIIKNDARTPVEIQKKTEAIEELAALRADEAIPLLVAQITFMNSRSKAKEFSIDAFHPAVATLKKLGKPASDACLKALRTMPLDNPTTDDGTQGWQYRASLLAAVIRGVEGDEVAEILLKRELAKADPTRAVVYDAILTPKK